MEAKVGPKPILDPANPLSIGRWDSGDEGRNCFEKVVPQQYSRSNHHIFIS